MADDPLGAGKPVAKLSRRAVVAGMTATPLVASTPAKFTPTTSNPWFEALCRYRVLTTRLWRHLEGAHLPGYLVAADAQIMAQHEAKSDELGRQCNEAFRAFFALPAPSIDDWVVKFEIAHDEHFAHEPDLEEIARNLLQDAHRLLPKRSPRDSD